MKDLGAGFEVICNRSTVSLNLQLQHSHRALTTYAESSALHSLKGSWRDCDRNLVFVWSMIFGVASLTDAELRRVVDFAQAARRFVAFGRSRWWLLGLSIY
jgi:hypothetical protein